MPHDPIAGGYYGQIRHDALALTDKPSFARVLEVGCGRGNTLGFLRESGRALHATGMELVDCEGAGHPLVDCIIAGNAETDPLPAGPFDLVLLLDVLEHLREPYLLLRKAVSALAQGGNIVISVPNIRFFRLVMKLLVKGVWEYEGAGILDRTHVHFFTDKSFRRELEAQCPSLRIVRAARNYGNQHRVVDRMLRHTIPDLVTVQNLYCLEKR